MKAIDYHKEFAFGFAFGAEIKLLLHSTRDVLMSDAQMMKRIRLLDAKGDLAIITSVNVRRATVTSLN